jgi:putative addiction module component (TIGR02574 family)
MTIAEIITAAKQLPVEDRRQIVQELQETLPVEDECFPLSPEWMTEIHRRAAELDAHPERAIPWEEVYERALAKIATYVDK